MRDPFLEGNEKIEAAIGHFHEEQSIEVLTEILEAIRERMHDEGHFILPIEDDEDVSRFSCYTIESGGKVWDVAFTSQEEYEKGERTKVLSYYIDGSLKYCKEGRADGLLINPWGRYFIVTNEMIDTIFEKDGSYLANRG